MVAGMDLDLDIVKSVARQLHEIAAELRRPDGQGKTGTINEDDNMPIDANLSPNTIESAASLLLDVADYLRQPEAPNPVEQVVRTRLRRKIYRQLQSQEEKGDPLQITETVREMMLA